MGHWTLTPRRTKRRILFALKLVLVSLAASIFVSSIAIGLSEKGHKRGGHLLGEIGSGVSNGRKGRRIGESQGEDIDVVYIDIQSLQRPSKEHKKNKVDAKQTSKKNKQNEERQQRPGFQLQNWASQNRTFQDEAHRLRRYINSPQVNCSIIYSVGTEAQNGAWPWKLCFDQRYFSTPEECVVYSFMVEKENFNFEEDLSERGCEVHLFNPGMKAHKLGSDKLQTHSINLDWKESSIRGIGDVRWSSRRLSSIMQELGHGEVDIVRMDIDSSEWKVLENILTDNTVLNIRQLIIKIHMMWAGYEVSGSNEAEVVRYWFSLLKFLEKSGFRLFSTVEDTASSFNFMGKNITNLRCCYTLSWVNTQDAYHNS